MFRGNYQKINSIGEKIYYKAGDTVLYEGNLYSALKPTTNSPFQDKKSWKFFGLSNVYVSETPPIEPSVGQHWEKNGKLYYYYYDGNNFSWVEL